MPFLAFTVFFALRFNSLESYYYAGKALRVFMDENEEIKAKNKMKMKNEKYLDLSRE